MRRLNLSGAQLYDLAKSSGSHLGWGVWTYRPANPERFELDVANSPFAHGHGPSDHPVCWPIVGMLTAIGELVHDRPVHVEVTACAAMSGGNCRFLAPTHRSRNCSPALDLTFFGKNHAGKKEAKPNR
jgi:hypothetical protein